MHKTLRFGAIVMLAWVAAGALTPLTSIAIRNSTIDSTTVGATTASTGRFTQLSAVAPPSNPTAGNSSTFGWNGTNGGGETDFINNRGAGTGGFNWYSTAASTAWVPNSPLMTLTAGGALSTTTSVGGPLGYFGIIGAGANTWNASNAQGGYIAWNEGSLGGETDFINSKGGGGGGFAWYNASTGGSLPAALMTINNIGVLTNSNGFVGPLTGNVNGNAATATQLAANPANCAANQVATGISNNGTPTCVPTARSVGGPGGSTGASSYSTTSSVVPISPAYPDSGYQAVCTLVNPSDPRASIYGITKAAGSVTVLVTTTGSVAISYGGVDCILKHN